MTLRRDSKSYFQVAVESGQRHVWYTDGSKTERESDPKSIKHEGGLKSQVYMCCIIGFIARSFAKIYLIASSCYGNNAALVRQSEGKTRNLLMIYLNFRLTVGQVKVRQNNCEDCWLKTAKYGEVVAETNN